MLTRFLARCIDCILPFGFVGQLVSRLDILTDHLAKLFELSALVFNRFQRPWLLRGLLSQINDSADNLAAFLMSEHHRTEHFFLSQFFRFGFDHHHRILRCGNNQIETARFIQSLLNHRVEFIFAIAEANARCTNRPHERNAGNGERCRGCDHRNDIWLCLAIIGQHLADHVDFVVEAFGEERAAWPVDQTAGERLFFRRPAFALEEATRNPAS